MRVAWVSAQKGRFQEGAAQLYITFQKASELKNHSPLYIYIYVCIIIRFFRVSSPHCFVLLGGSAGLISFGDLAWSLQGKTVLLRMHLFHTPSSPSWCGGWGEGQPSPPVHRNVHVVHGQIHVCTRVCV